MSSSNNPSTSTKMKVCVIGGGLGGLTVCTSLRQFARDHRKVEIYLIEPKEYIEIPWCSIRNIFDTYTESCDVDGGRHSGNWVDASIIKIERWANMKGVKHIRATCNKLTKHHAELSNGETIEFTVCCVCVGAQTRYQGLGRGPPKPVAQQPPSGGQAHQQHHHHPQNVGTISRRIHQLKHEKSKLLKSKSVAIIGGGLIGVEFAGELADEAKKQNKHIQITLIHSQDRLIPTEFTPKASEMALKKLTKLGINVKLNEKAVPIRRKSHGDSEDESKEGSNQQPSPSISPPPSPTKQSATQGTASPTPVVPNAVRLVNSNETFEADTIIWTTGLIPINSSFMETQYLNNKGYIHVDEYFRIVGSDNKLFALGDCCDLLPNQGTQILGTFNIIGKNIKSILKAIEKDKLHDEQYLERKMRKALSVSGTIVVTIGKSTGVASPIFGMHTQFGLPWLKNSTMFLYKPKQTIGLL